MRVTFRKKHATVVGVLIAALLASACGPDDENEKPVRFANKALGVSVTTTQSNLGDSKAKVAIKKSTEKINFGLAAPAGKVVDIATTGGTLDGTAEITLDVPKKLKATDVAIYTYDKALKQPILMGGEPAKNGRALKVKTNHFSKWWVSPIDPALLPPSINAASVLIGRLNDFFRAAPKTECEYPATTTTAVVDKDTLPKGVDVCAIYDKNNQLTLDIGNSSGAPLLITPGPGLKYKSIDGGQTSTNAMVAGLRQKLGDDRVSLGGARRVVFTVDRKHIAKNGEVHVAAQLDISYTVLAFSGALLDMVAPLFKDDHAAQQALSAANGTAKYSACIDENSQALKDKLIANELTAAEFNRGVARVHSNCSNEFIKLMDEALRQTDKLNPLYQDSITLQLVKQVAKRVSWLFDLVGNTGNLITQPLYTAHHAGNTSGNYEFRADVNEPPAPADRDGALPDDNDGPFLRAPQAQELPTEVNGKPIDYRPTPGANCDKLEMQWNPDWLEKEFGRRTSLLAGGKIHAATSLAVVPKEHRAAVARYFTFLRDMKECDTVASESLGGTTYKIAYQKKAINPKVEWPGKYVVAYREFIGYTASEGDRLYHAYVYDKDRGYLFALTATVAEGRDANYTSGVEDAEFERAITQALPHMHKRLGQSLGMH